MDLAYWQFKANLHSNKLVRSRNNWLRLKTNTLSLVVKSSFMMFIPFRKDLENHKGLHRN